MGSCGDISTTPHGCASWLKRSEIATQSTPTGSTERSPPQGSIFFIAGAESREPWSAPGGGGFTTVANTTLRPSSIRFRMGQREPWQGATVSLADHHRPQRPLAVACTVGVRANRLVDVLCETIAPFQRVHGQIRLQRLRYGRAVVLCGCIIGHRMGLFFSLLTFFCVVTQAIGVNQYGVGRIHRQRPSSRRPKRKAATPGRRQWAGAGSNQAATYSRCFSFSRVCWFRTQRAGRNKVVKAAGIIEVERTGGQRQRRNGGIRPGTGQPAGDGIGPLGLLCAYHCSVLHVTTGHWVFYCYMM